MCGRSWNWNQYCDGYGFFDKVTCARGAAPTEFIFSSFKILTTASYSFLFSPQTQCNWFLSWGLIFEKSCLEAVTICYGIRNQNSKITDSALLEHIFDAETSDTMRTHSVGTLKQSLPLPKQLPSSKNNNFSYGCYGFCYGCYGRITFFKLVTDP